MITGVLYVKNSLTGKIEEDRFGGFSEFVHLDNLPVEGEVLSFHQSYGRFVDYIVQAIGDNIVLLLRK